MMWNRPRTHQDKNGGPANDGQYSIGGALAGELDEIKVIQDNCSVDVIAITVEKDPLTGQTAVEVWVKNNT